MTQTNPTPASPRRGVPAWVQVIVWAILFGLLALVAFGLRNAQQGTVQVGDTIPGFSLTLFDGYQYQDKSTVSLADFKGKVVVINFWASWCKPCEEEAAELEAVWRANQANGNVIFLGVDYTDTEPEARGYLTKFDISYPNGPDLGTRISQMFRIKGVPETYFIDENGVLKYIQIGPFASSAEIQRVIDQLLND